MNLSQLAILLGAVCAATHAYILLRPEPSMAFLRKFHRNVPLGIFFTLLATAWFEYNLFNSDVTDFAQWKPLMLAGLGLIGVGTCFYVQDYISVRGGAALALLIADVVLDTQRWSPSPWKNVITVWMYVWICLSCWVVVQPWRIRDWILWATTFPKRLKMLSLSGLSFGLLVIVLGLTTYR
ncbi:MAG TPA: hypothetical protein VMF06_02800 [Candidatus Limnocylindria bacterium]|jgi:hypothetical protein|nr:hypothetical protein [Candidatus Limnocylindria bacterium]